MSNKTKLFQDVYTNVIPERVPVDVNLSYEAIASLGGISLKYAQWDQTLVEEPAKEVCEKLHSDTCPIKGLSRAPGQYKEVGSRSFVFSKSGIMQHPEISSMDEEDYDFLIEKPYDCLIERAIPRFNDMLDLRNEPGLAMLSYAKSLDAKAAVFGEFAKVSAPITKGYEYCGRFPGAATAAPFDFLADILRSFSYISVDIRRRRQQVYDACEALFPLLFKLGTPAVINEYSKAAYWTHMPTFLRTKDFEELWWPSFYKMAVNYAAMGVGINSFCEDDWSRYTSHLADLPVNSVLRIEEGDPEEYKKALGDRHVLTGIYKFTNLKAFSAEGCKDLAKELMDIMAPGGRYIFSFDKILMMINRDEFDKLCHLIDFVIEYGTYGNAGEKSGKDFVQSVYTALPARTFESKYYKDWRKEEGIDPKVASMLQKYEDKQFGEIMNFFR